MPDFARLNPASVYPGTQACRLYTPGTICHSLDNRGAGTSPSSCLPLMPSPLLGARGVEQVRARCAAQRTCPLAFSIAESAFSSVELRFAHSAQPTRYISRWLWCKVVNELVLARMDHRREPDLVVAEREASVSGKLVPLA